MREKGNGKEEKPVDAMKIRLLVARREQHRAFALCAAVVQASEGEIAGEATHMAGALRDAAAVRPDVLLLEHLQDDEPSAHAVLSGLPEASARTRVLLLCDVYTHQSIIDFIQRGANGCALSSSEPWLLAKAVRTVHRGESWFGRTDLVHALRSQMRLEPAVTSEVLRDQDLLTTREREILGLIGAAMTNKEIARKLKISDHTVKTHLHHIYVKLERSGRYKAFLSKPLTGAALQIATLPGPRPGGFAGS